MAFLLFRRGPRPQDVLALPLNEAVDSIRPFAHLINSGFVDYPPLGGLRRSSQGNACCHVNESKAGSAFVQDVLPRLTIRSSSALNGSEGFRGRRRGRGQGRLGRKKRGSAVRSARSVPLLWRILGVVIKMEFVRMRTQAQGVVFFTFVADPHFQEVSRKDVTFQEELVVVFQMIQRL